MVGRGTWGILCLNEGQNENFGGHNELLNY